MAISFTEVHTNTLAAAGGRRRDGEGSCRYQIAGIYLEYAIYSIHLKLKSCTGIVCVATYECVCRPLPSVSPPAGDCSGGAASL